MKAREPPGGRVGTRPVIGQVSARVARFPSGSVSPGGSECSMIGLDGELTNYVVDRQIVAVTAIGRVPGLATQSRPAAPTAARPGTGHLWRRPDTSQVPVLPGRRDKVSRFA